MERCWGLVSLDGGGRDVFVLHEIYGCVFSRL